MNKQITYPKLIPRLFATIMDLFLLAITANLINALMLKCGIGELAPLANTAFGFSLMSVYFLGFWLYKGTTPGKILMRTKIVDAKTLQAPGKLQLIIRFLIMPFFFIGIWFIPLTKQSQALHDKIAGTAVIKT